MTGKTTQRYKVVEGSQQGHGCCFHCTVVDTTKPIIIGGKHYKGSNGLMYEVVCETFGHEEADLICDALNSKEVSEAAK